MTRNSGNADRLMLEAAKKIVCEDGCSGLRIRQLVKKAGVNLGMFHYHFRNKKRFKRALLQEMYENFFQKITEASGEKSMPAEEQLRCTLMAMGLFVLAESGFYMALIKDILNDDLEVLAFVEQNVPRHMAVVRELVVKCQQEGSMAPLPFPQIMSFLMTSLNMPILVGGMMMRHEEKHDRSRAKSSSYKKYLADVISEDAIAQRIELALKGLRP